MTIELWITSGIALGGLILGLTNFIRDVKRYSPKIIIRTSLVINNNPLDNNEYYHIQIVNSSMVSIPIDYISLGAKGDLQVYSDHKKCSVNLPYKLEQGDTISATYPEKSIAQALYRATKKSSIKIRPYCKDAAGNKYYGKWEGFNIARWIDVEES